MYVPPVENETDTQNIEEIFTEEEVKDTYEIKTGSVLEAMDKFGGFTYDPKNKMQN